ncbi:hypothetical protein BDFB_006061 [Asbolus verrucosus]|uniref:Uncharacterized protein n=1 Tax=Asbolus verrucosus TaxID=1661398 RepID=A0A482VVF8_ASBVE|nr:hypothetical protein BDFB_006061 [Asbolus verrucosus]
MADEEYNKKLESLQQYVPFLNRMIAQLKEPEIEDCETYKCTISFVRRLFHFHERYAKEIGWSSYESWSEKPLE